MSVLHRVKQGECLVTIANQYGLKDYKIIYDHPKNATFKQRRPNPNIVHPGDVLFIPDKQDKQESRATTQQHRFVTPTNTVLLRIIVEDGDGRALAHKKYCLKVAGQMLTGCTDAQGLLEQHISQDATEGELRIWLKAEDEGLPGKGHLFPLAIGSLDPVEEITGVQARLNNLGFHCGEIDGICGPHTKKALKAFQAKYRLTESGAIDATSRQKLREMHDGK